MLAFMLLSGCLINADLYARRLAELRATGSGAPDDDTDTDDTDTDDTGPDDTGPDDTSCVPERVWADADGDGYGNPAFADERCPEAGWVDNADDCDDTNAAVHPTAEEVCGTGVDEDCDGDQIECRAAGEVRVEAADITLVGGSAGFGLVSPLGDVDGDGRDDLAVIGDHGVYVLGDPGNGTHALDDVSRSIANDEPELDFHRAIATDLDGDGQPELVVAAISSSVTGPSRLWWLGAPTAGGTSTTAARAASVFDDADRAVGFFLARGADLTGDGHEELVVSDVAFDGVSSVRLYQHSGGMLDGPVASVEGLAGDALGYATAVGDVDGDGLEDLLASAPGDAGERGAVYVFEAPITDRTVDSADVVFVGGEAGDRLGVSVVFDPLLDADGDGDADVLLGAWGASTIVSGGGAAYLFTGPVGGRLEPSDAVGTYLGAHADAGMGWAVSSGDVEGDGRGDILLSANPPLSTDDTGRTYLAHGPATGTYLESEMEVRFVSASSGARLGSGSTVLGDIDADGTDDLLLLDPAAESGLGAAYLYRSWTP